MNASVNYNYTKDKHLLSLFGRWNVDESKSNSVNLSAMGFPNDNMDDFLFAYEMEDRVSGTESTSRTVGIIGQVSYMYDMRFSGIFPRNSGRTREWHLFGLPGLVGTYIGKNGCKTRLFQTWCYAGLMVSRGHKVILLTRRKRLTRTMICCSPIRLRIYWERS